jgi:histone H3/H4
MESYAIDLSERSVQLAQHAKRKTVRSDDVKLAARGFD